MDSKSQKSGMTLLSCLLILMSFTQEGLWQTTQPSPARGPAHDLWNEDTPKVIEIHFWAQCNLGGEYDYKDYLLYTAMLIFGMLIGKYLTEKQVCKASKATSLLKRSKHIHLHFATWTKNFCHLAHTHSISSHIAVPFTFTLLPLWHLPFHVVSMWRLSVLSMRMIGKGKSGLLRYNRLNLRVHSDSAQGNGYVTCTAYAHMSRDKQDPSVTASWI